MLTIYKIALGPALLLQGSRLRKTALRLPEAQGPRAGLIGDDEAPPLRLLFIGDSSVAGVGVDWQHEAMPQQAAGIVAKKLSRPVSWQIIARSGINTLEAMDLLHSNAPGPTDIAICALGVNDVTAQHGASRFISDYRALLAAIEQRTGAGAAVISGLPPLRVLPAAPQPLRWYLGQCAKRLDQALKRLCDDQGNTRYVSLAWAKAADMAADKFHPGKGQHRAWADLVADQVCSLMQDVAAQVSLEPANAFPQKRAKHDGTR